MRILIIEDEASILDRLVRFTRDILRTKLQSLDTASSLEEAEQTINSKLPDLVMLDLNLNGKDGFDLLKGLTSRPFHTIVVSAYSQRAIEAYELGVVDFVPKPFDKARLQQSFDRLTLSQSQRDHFAKYLAVRSPSKIDLIDLEEIEYIIADGPCSLIVCTDGKEFRHDKMLKNLSLLLPPSFNRVHKSYLANLNQIIGFEFGKGHKNTLRFKSGRKIPISRGKTKEIKEKLNL